MSHGRGYKISQKDVTYYLNGPLRLTKTGGPSSQIHFPSVFSIPRKKSAFEVVLFAMNCSSFDWMKSVFGIISWADGLRDLHCLMAFSFVADVVIMATQPFWSNHSNPSGQTDKNIDWIWGSDTELTTQWNWIILINWSFSYSNISSFSFWMLPDLAQMYWNDPEHPEFFTIKLSFLDIILQDPAVVSSQTSPEGLLNLAYAWKFPLLSSKNYISFQSIFPTLKPNTIILYIAQGIKKMLSWL